MVKDAQGRVGTIMKKITVTASAPVSAPTESPTAADGFASPPALAPLPGTTVFADDLKHGGACVDFSAAGWSQCHQKYEDRLVTGIVDGRQAATMTVYNDDWSGANPRVQLNSKSSFVEGTEQIISWGSYIFPDFPSSPPWSCIAEWFASPYNGSPRVSIGIENNRFVFERDAAYNWDRVWSMPLVKEQWVDFQFRIKWSATASVGWVELKVNGQQQTFTNGQTRLVMQTLKPDQNGRVETILNNYWAYGAATRATLAHSALRVVTL